MASNVAQLFSFRPRSNDWSNQELAEFYRVEASLVQAGLLVDTDRGITDENEPWFVFCNSETGDVIIHFARIDGAYVAASGAFDGVLRGRDFRSVVEALLSRHPLVMPKARDNIRLHPSSLLVALVATAFFKLSDVDAQASEANHKGSDGGSSREIWIKSDGDVKQASIQLDRRHVAVVLAAMTFAVTHDFNGDWTHWLSKAADWLDEDHGASDVAAAPRLASDLIEFANLAETPSDAAPVRVEHASILPLDGGHIEQLATLFGDKLSLLSLLTSLMNGTQTAEKAGGSGVELPGAVAVVEDLSTYNNQEAARNGSSAAADTPREMVAGRDREVTTEQKADSAEVVTVVLSQSPSEQSSLPVVEAVRYVESSGLASVDSREILKVGDGLLASLTSGDIALGPIADVLPEAASTPSSGQDGKDQASGLAVKIEALFGDNRPLHAFHDDADDYKSVMATFKEKNADFEVALSGKDIVFYDLTPDVHPGDALSFVTWTFEDGSTLSLIGVLPHEIAIAA
ncbi:MULTISPECIES: hypothetical protein [unclassified Chelatococcus]|uniref:hypothetical protein n=1 Tax=unclassified Chelatococcus TaxID=2638111 RepID=UPI001BD02664|nr:MULTISPECIES: hypothetical protein [unclassified Chelatococcus]MBS7699044.1 hypothetical protein [Chelatococcus sp. YT9]MBX3559967.1 hypothetical protein [Chelatococcus sp.]